MKTWAQCLLSICLVLIIYGFSACQKSFDSKLLKAKTSFEKKDFVEAIDASASALRRWKESDGLPKKAEALEVLGLSYLKIHKTNKAEEAFEEAIQLSHALYEAPYQLGLMSLGQKKYQRASRLFSKALQVKPDDSAALLGLGDSFYLVGKYVEAQAAYERILDTSPGVRSALKNLDLIRKKKRPKRK